MAMGSNDLDSKDEVRTLPSSFSRSSRMPRSKTTSRDHESSLLSGISSHWGPLSTLINGGIHFLGQHFGKKKSHAGLISGQNDEEEELNQPFQNTLLRHESLVLERLPSLSTSSSSLPSLGLGHVFESVLSSNPTWCDICGDVVWEPLTEPSSTVKKASRCVACHLTCHAQCRQELKLNCSSLKVEDDDSSTDVFYDAEQPASTLSNISSSILDDELLFNDDEDSQATLKATLTLSSSSSSTLWPSSTLRCSLSSDPERLVTLVSRYNSFFESSQQTKVEDEVTCSCRGYIRVQMNLRRPINVRRGTQPPTVLSVLKGDESVELSNSHKKSLSAFYLEPSTVRTLSLDTSTTCGQVIRSLLRTFRIVDSPHKYVVYEKQVCDESESSKDSLLNGRVRMRKLGDEQRPLELALLWLSEDNFEKKAFVLQENDPGELIAWESFSVPELNNFLRILDREEAAYKRGIHEKYERIHNYMQQLIDQMQPTTDVSSRL